MGRSSSVRRLRFSSVQQDMLFCRCSVAVYCVCVGGIASFNGEMMGWCSSDAPANNYTYIAIVNRPFCPGHRGGDHVKY